MATASERDRATILRDVLAGTRLSQVDWVEETGSTNADLVSLAQAGSGERVLITDLQTAGRGRRDRVWHAPKSSALMLSMLIRNADPADAFWYVGALALSGAEAAANATGADVELKWPNDLVIADQKLAGILAQQTGDALVVGMGMNVRWLTDMPAEFAARATSLDRHLLGDRHVAGSDAVEGAAGVDRVELACDVLRRAARWLDAPQDELRSAWIGRCATMQRHVRIELDDRNEVGVAVDVDASGALIVDQGGSCVMFHVGDVVHLRPNNGPLTG